MAADRPLRNLPAESLLGVYVELQAEPPDKKYNLRKELETDRRNQVYSNRWVTRDQYMEMARDEIAARGLELPAVAEAAPGPETGAEAAPETKAEPEAEGTPKTKPAAVTKGKRKASGTPPREGAT